MNCCIAGGGPAGMMLGYLLARQGVEVTVLEKHADFLRDFRGDTVHPSTLELFYELGLLDEFLQLPHQRLTATGGVYGDYPFTAADFSHLPTHCRFVALMPQWDLLNFVAVQAQKLPSFHLRMNCEATGLIREGGRVSGAETTSGPICADLVVGCDGRRSVVRAAAGLKLDEFGAPIDVLWFRLSRNDSDTGDLRTFINRGKAIVMIPRGDYFQVALIIRKGSFDSMRARPIATLQTAVCQVAPLLADRVEELPDWDQVKLLTVQLNRLREWCAPGVLCIGDAAHAMSPIGGVGINLAIQDAVATANLLGERLRRGNLEDADLAKVQARREFPARVTQAFQARAHRMLEKVFQNEDQLHAPLALKAALAIPGIQRFVGRMVGVGARPEHIQS